MDPGDRHRALLHAAAAQNRAAAEMISALRHQAAVTLEPENRAAAIERAEQCLSRACDLMRVSAAYLEIARGGGGPTGAMIEGDKK